ncbi:MAG: helix-turn-helix domain-containing protein [Pseudomonas sp.]
MNALSSRKQIVIRSDAMAADQFGALYTQLFGNLYADLPPPTQPITIAGVYGRHDGVSFRRMSYRGELTTALPDLHDEITFVIPTAGTIVFKQKNETIGTPALGLAVEKTSVRSVRFFDGHEQYGLSVRRGLFAERLSMLLGKPIVDKVRFQPTVDFNQAAFQGLKAIVDLATGNEFDLLINASVLLPARLQEMLIDAVLDSWPHNYSEALHRPAPAIAPRHVKLAVEYLQAHPDVLVSGSELAALSNVSLRALQDGFRRFVGSSIVEYQRQVRLARAHHLLQDEGAPSVTDVALRLGFSNVGRFCQYFQSAYGLSPAELKNGGRKRH